MLFKILKKEDATDEDTKIDEDKKAKIDFSLMLGGMLLFHQLEEELFGEEKENE